MTSTTRMLVLGLLRERPMHGYEITQLIAEGELDRWAPVLPGSVYHALGKMERDGLVRTEAEEWTGDRQRTVYAITGEGRAELARLLLGVLAEPPHALRSALPLALSWADVLPREQVLAQVEAALAKLARTREDYRRGREAKAGRSPLAAALFDNADAILDADEHLLRRVLDLLAVSPRGDISG
ncbi:PadR family transcriptional regulator [Nonomuraea typhae]|uniref:PadR family transcriptional regulator n=1 Tax=Nonomuraea typhae TaxID=2603600 RepID=A0ABW7Z816_9ACTN